MRKNKPVLIVVAGPNGSGKTTITERLLTHSWTDNAVNFITVSGNKEQSNKIFCIYHLLNKI
jgi:uridine kinase